MHFVNLSDVHNPIAIQLALTDQDKQHSIHQQAQTGELEKQIMEF